MSDVKFASRLTNAIKRERLLECRDVLDSIREIIERDYQSSISAMQKEENFAYGAWSELQARYIGEQIALKNLINLLTVKDMKS